MYKNLVSDVARVGILAAITFFSAAVHAASSVALAWDASPGPNIAGYTVRYGTVSGVYPSSQNAGSALTTTISTLTAGTRYYFVVTARTAAGLESDPSNQISYTPPATPVPNVLPTLNSISNVTISEDAGPQTASLTGITAGIGDVLQLLTVTATSSNPSLIPAPAVTYVSPNTTGTLRLTPAANSSGSATITVSVRDGGLLNNLLSRTFTVTVNPVNDVPTLTPLSNLALPPNSGQQTISLSGISAGAANESQPLSVTATSSNPSLIPTPTVTYASPGATGTLRFTPVVSASGTATITVMANDGQPANNGVTRTFTVTVSAGNVAPTLNAIANVAINEDAAQQTVSLAGITSGSASENQALTVTAASSNTALILNPAVTYSSPGTTGTLRFTPAANASGTATITVTINDGQSANNVISRTFSVTVNAVNDAPKLNPINNLSLAINALRQTVSLAGISSGAANESQPLTVTATSSNPGLIPTPTITYASPGATGSLAFTPVAGAIGTATVTVRVSDGQAQSNTISRSFTVTVTGTAIQTFYVEAESGARSSPMTVAASPAAGNGQYAYSTAADQGTISFALNIAKAGNYWVWCRVLSPDTGSDSFFVRMDGAAEDIYPTAINQWSSAWQWSRLNAGGSPRSYTLAQGAHTLVFRCREAHTLLDALYVSNDPSFVPAAVAAVAASPAYTPEGDPEPEVAEDDGVVPSDAVGPEVSELEVVHTDARTITLRWRTDEPSLCRLDYGIAVPLDNHSPVETDYTTEHSVSLSRLQSETSYLIQVQSIDAAGNLSLTEIGQAATSQRNILAWTAETPQLIRPFVAPENSHTNEPVSGSSEVRGQRSVSLPVSVEASSGYTIWCRLWVLEPGDAAFLVSVDDEEQLVFSPADDGLQPGWRWIRAGERPVQLDAGFHQFGFKLIPAGMWFDELILSNDPEWIPEG